ncbi:helix-turn-helix domain-containing protein [Streptomyces fradiae]|uniref:helix-turn-helix domain-containing protein n=1 Tax=Streptomyces fradiae TaxID=1906 RepID=UPI00294327AD|nr:GAF domain-containing protein [Streptomyces fradiae]WOI60583.1 GAF domain-containing protein [Streptomyces fradiae]
MSGEQQARHQHDQVSFLELLARGAAVEAYDRPVLLARADGADAAALAGLEHAKQLALRVRAELEGRRRREAELSALFETAHDLAGLRDLDAVLRAIVQRARSLLGTEVAYLSLNDPVAGDTYMRVTDGSVSARFQQLRLGMGEGLGGLVAQTARPYVTDDYFRDDRFQHTRAIDAGVRDEGLVAILGVPLTLGSQVIGVLFAADRRARVFERGQVALLGSFAAHAAVAIDTANLLAETRTALTELERANGIIRDRSGVIERASEVHDRLTELVLRGGGVRDVADAVSEVLGGTVEFTEARQPRASADGRAVRRGDAWVAAVSAGGEVFGALVLRCSDRLDPVDRRTLERAAMVTSLLLLAHRSAGEAEQRVRGELLDDLIDAPGRDPRLLKDRAARLHADFGVRHVVLAARLERDREDPAADGPAPGDAAHPRTSAPTAPPSASATSGAPAGGAAAAPAGPGRAHADRQRLWSAASHLAATRRGLASNRDGGTVLLLPLGPDETAAGVARRTALDLGRTLREPVTVGASAPAKPPAADPAAIGPAYAEARRCLGALALLGRAGEGAAADDLGFLGLLLADRGDIDGFVERTIGPVVAYDRRRGTELVRTLDAYYATGMSPARTRELLHVHVNTVAQRLERVGRLLGEDWQSPDRSLEVRLALRLHLLSPALSR